MRQLSVDILVSNLPVEIKDIMFFLRIRDKIKRVQFISRKYINMNELISTNYNSYTSFMFIVHSN